MVALLPPLIIYITQVRAFVWIESLVQFKDDLSEHCRYFLLASLFLQQSVGKKKTNITCERSQIIDSVNSLPFLFVRVANIKFQIKKYQETHYSPLKGPFAVKMHSGCEREEF